VPYSQYEKINFTLAGKWGLQKGDTIHADLLADAGWNIGFPALPMDVGYAHTLLASVAWSHSRPQNIINHLATKVYTNTVQHSMDDTHRENISMHMDMPGKTNTVGFFTEGRFKKKGNHAISFRGDGFYNHSIAEMTMYPEGEPSMYMQTWPSTHRIVGGAYISDTYFVNLKTELQADVRLDYAVTTIEEGIGADQLLIFYPEMMLTRHQVVPSVNGSLRNFLFPDLQLTIQTGYAQRLPSLSEHAGFYLFNRMDGYDYIGNPSLKNEKTWNTSLALNYWGRKIEAEMDVFVQHLSDYIFGTIDTSLSPMTPDANGVKRYSNVNHVIMHGFETSISYSPVPAVKFIQQTKFVHATMSDDEPLPLIPPFTSQFSMRYSWASLSVQADTEWAVAQHRINKNFGEDGTPAYYVANLRFEYQWKKNKNSLRIQTGVENIFNRYYHAHLDWGNIPRPGRNVFLTVEYRL
jgi:iron complex outermembrane receptor protein